MGDCAMCTCKPERDWLNGTLWSATADHAVPVDAYALATLMFMDWESSEIGAYVIILVSVISACAYTLDLVGREQLNSECTALIAHPTGCGDRGYEYITAACIDLRKADIIDNMPVSDLSPYGLVSIIIIATLQSLENAAPITAIDVIVLIAAISVFIPTIVLVKRKLIPVAASLPGLIMSGSLIAAVIIKLIMRAF